jgi:signal recognition particle subunit SRP54
MPGVMGGRKAAAKAKAARNAKGKRRSGDPRKAGLAAVPSPEEPAAAAQAAPQSMKELEEMLRDAQAAGGPAGFGDDGEARPGFRGGPSALPPAFGGGGRGNTLPAAFGKRDKKKK